MFVLDGKPLALDRAFTHDGIQYPSRWLRLASPEERAAIGITEQAPPPVWDQRFYWGYSEDGSLIEKDLDGLKEQWIGQVKQTANSLLAQSDWAITRASDPSSGKAVSTAVLEERGRIRAKSDEKELAINNATSVGDLAAYLTSQEFSNWTAEQVEQPVDGGDDSFIIDGVTSGTVISGDSLFGGGGEDTIVLS